VTANDVADTFRRCDFTMQKSLCLDFMATTHKPQGRWRGKPPSAPGDYEAWAGERCPGAEGPDAREDCTMISWDRFSAVM
jgi:hypothetical protein